MTESLKLGLLAATGGIVIAYLVDVILQFLRVGIPLIHESGALSIGFSVFVVMIAAPNLVPDFDFVERGVVSGARFTGTGHSN